MNDGRQLLEDHLNGQALTAEQREALSAWICASKQNARDAAELLHMDQAIRDRLDQVSLDTVGWSGFYPDDSAAAMALAELARLHDEALGAPIDLAARRRSMDQKAHAPQRPNAFRARMAVAGGLAAVIALAGVVALLVTVLSRPAAQVVEAPEPAPKPTFVVATLTDTRDARWEAEGESIDLTPGTALYAGQRLTLTHGLAELTTVRGARAVLESPCSIELLDNPNALRLHAGKLVGIVEHDRAKRFLVRTPHMDVTDLGTEFGVAVRDSRSETSVFSGEIELTGSDLKPHRITGGQTARVDRGAPGAQVEIRDQVAEDYARWLPRSRIVTNARLLNAEGFALKVVEQGVREQARLYADRAYELHGMGGNGIAPMLLGGDLVRMPVDAKPRQSTGTESMQVELALARPAQVYIILPPNAKPAGWLKRDYELTAMRVRYHVPDAPGRNAYRVCEVWQRRQPAEGRVVAAGPLQPNSDGMYAIIVTALKAGEAGDAP